MARSSKRPKPANVADLRARVVRGPDAEHRWYWRVWRTRNGEEETISTGWWAEHQIDRVLAGLVTTGVDTPRARNRVDTVRDLMEFWIGSQGERGDLSPRTVEVRRAAARHVCDGLGAVVLDSVDRLCLERYRDRRLREPVTFKRKQRDETGALAADAWEDVPTGRTSSPRSVAFEIHVLRMAWRWGKEVGIVPAKELPRVAVRIQGHTRDRYTPSTTEIARVLRELEGWARLALLLYAGTGCRLDEVASLRWSDIDLAGELLTVRGKTGRRVVPIPPPLVRALLAAPPGAPSERVLSCAHSTARAIYDRLQVACKHAGVPYFAPGGLRRAAVNALYRSGNDPAVAGALIGHSPVVAMRHYRQVAGDDAREAMRNARLGYLPELDDNVVELPRKQKS